MTEPTPLNELIATARQEHTATLRPDAVLDAGALPRAEVRETHTAVVFFVGDRAYKLKKPVDLTFLDYSTVEARRAACEREVALNRRFAPDVYLGVGEIRVPGAETPEPLVAMRRMPAERRLSRLVREGAVVDDALRAVARLLATRHAGAVRTPDVDAQGSRDALSARWEASFAQVREMAVEGRVLEDVAEIEPLVRRYLAGREPLFDMRVEQGRIVDGHAGPDHARLFHPLTTPSGTRRATSRASPAPSVAAATASTSL
jgi:aminoglycoside phosphotransferase family enzyme